jgi:hypothetical protein
VKVTERRMMDDTATAHLSPLAPIEANVSVSYLRSRGQAVPNPTRDLDSHQARSEQEEQSATAEEEPKEPYRYRIAGLEEGDHEECRADPDEQD